MQLPPQYHNYNFTLKELPGIFSQASDQLLRKLFLLRTGGGGFSSCVWKEISVFEPRRNIPYNNREERESLILL